MANLLCASFLREKFSFPWSILSFFRSGLPKPHCVRFWQPSRSQKRKNWSRKRKSFSQKRNCACELCHFSAMLFQLLRRYILATSPRLHKSQLKNITKEYLCTYFGAENPFSPSWHTWWSYPILAPCKRQTVWQLVGQLRIKSFLIGLSDKYALYLNNYFNFHVCL